MLDGQIEWEHIILQYHYYTLHEATVVIIVTIHFT